MKISLAGPWTRMHWAPAVAALLMSGCASTLPVYEGAERGDPVAAAPSAPAERLSPPQRPDPSFIGVQVARYALAMRGTPYRYGGATPRGFDCSGLVQFSYSQAGIPVPRTTAEQFHAATRIDRREARPGDLLFFRIRHTVSHVGIYIGGGEFVHAPSSGRRVEVTSLDQPYYRNRFVGAGRLHPAR